MKLLVLWREDEPAEERLAMVDKFVRRCRSAGLVSIIEPVVRPPRRGWDFDRESAIVAAAAELGGTEADLYKAEMPLGGKGDEKTLLAACQQLNDQMKMPWVILSSGVDADIFGRAVSIAMKGGASGFLAGRAVWASVVGAQDPQTMLRDVSGVEFYSKALLLQAVWSRPARSNRSVHKYVRMASTARGQNGK